MFVFDCLTGAKSTVLNAFVVKSKVTGWIGCHCQCCPWITCGTWSHLSELSFTIVLTKVTVRGGRVAKISAPSVQFSAAAWSTNHSTESNGLKVSSSSPGLLVDWLFLSIPLNGQENNQQRQEISLEPWALNLDLLVRGEASCSYWLLFIGTSGPPRKQNSYLISFCIENTILQFIISTTCTFFLVFLSFFWQ